MVSETSKVEFHNPGNHLPRIDKVWMFVSVDATGEGICAFPMPGSAMLSVPMVAADEERLAALKQIARGMCNKYGITIKLIELHTRTEVETYTP